MMDGHAEKLLSGHKFESGQDLATEVGDGSVLRGPEVRKS